ncbi:MAG: LytTR family DNA-binding domain-containing protein [Myxococcota bacterium]
MTSLKVLIADDEQLARARLARLLTAMPNVEIVGEAKDGDEVLARVRQGGVDLVLLDIQMPKLSGTEALALWPREGPWVVFCTAHAEHAVAAFDGGAVDYLLKPVEPQRLAKALERARERGTRKAFAAALEKHQLSRLAITTRQGVVLVDPAAVTCAVLEDELVTVHTRESSYLTDFTLNELEERLPAGKFERVHRRAIVNLEAVSRLEPLETGGYTARTSSGHSVEVSRQSARELRRRLGLRKAPGDQD